MLIQILGLVFNLYNFAITQNTTEIDETKATASTLYPNNMTRGKLFHTEDEVLRLLLVPKISRGEPANLGEIPYQVALKAPIPQDRKVYSTFCGASILKPKTLLTAAHCFVQDSNILTICTGRVNQRLVKVAYAVAGNLDNSARFSKTDSKEGQWRRIADVRHLSSYSFPKDDIAILKLKKPFIFNEYIKPIVVATAARDYGGLQCLASGYGKISKNKRSTNLRKAVLEVLPVRTCDRLFRMQTKKMVCTTDKVADVLEGDSGGPLVCSNTNDPADPENTGIQIGLVSGGIPGRGSLFTRLSSFKNYIARGTSNMLYPNAITVTFVLFLSR